MKAYVATRPADIVSEIGEGCHIYNTFGFCIYGAMCRFGASHINMATGINILKDPDSEGIPPTLNGLTKDVQIQLRKNKYPFKTQRNYEKKTDTAPVVQVEKTDGLSVDAKAETTAKVEGTNDAPAKGASMDLSPLPSTRKIVDFSNKVYVAPLTTVGNLPFRRVMKRLGADITCGEMALAANLLSGQPSEWALLKRHPDEDIFGVQIAASYPDMWTRVSEMVENEMTVDFMDMNLGCPLDMVCSKGAGSALMMREKRLKQSLAGITGALSCPVTIKMRTGWDMANPFAHELVPKIQSWGYDGIGVIMIHGRSRLQRYSKDSDWPYISRAATSQDPSKPLIPIIGNGDIFSYTDYEEKIALEGVSSCAMIGRGALIKPWLPTEIKERRHWDISASERLDILKDFVKFGLEHWGSDQQVCYTALRRLLFKHMLS
jgi:tRNA-dihydrouridine synthase 3